jgi:hypothetical protein
MMTLTKLIRRFAVSVSLFIAIALSAFGIFSNWVPVYINFETWHGNHLARACEFDASGGGFCVGAGRIGGIGYFPWGEVILPFLVLPGIELLLIWRRWRRPVVLPGKCVVCGYDLRATPDRCPECGTVPPGKGPPAE